MSISIELFSCFKEAVEVQDEAMALPTVTILRLMKGKGLCSRRLTKRLSMKR